MVRAPNDIRISVALVTCNRFNSLERCLQSWRNQTIPPFEIVISDDSDPKNVLKMRKLAARFDCVYTSGPKRGLYANRNHASLACKGTHILSADDDHTHPTDFVENIRNILSHDPQTIWTFCERNPLMPADTPGFPGELHRSGFGCAPKDWSNSAAISDGASVYPKLVFENGLRYDETYPFGAIWYLWGKLLVSHGWRISLSRTTFVWHHHETGNRFYDRDALVQQLECRLYAIWVNALYFSTSLRAYLWALFYTARIILKKESGMGFFISCRLSPLKAWRAFRRALIFSTRESTRNNAVQS